MPTELWEASFTVVSMKTAVTWEDVLFLVNLNTLSL